MKIIYFIIYKSDILSTIYYLDIQMGTGYNPPGQKPLDKKPPIIYIWTFYLSGGKIIGSTYRQMMNAWKFSSENENYDFKLLKEKLTLFTLHYKYIFVISMNSTIQFIENKNGGRNICLVVCNAQNVLQFTNIYIQLISLVKLYINFLMSWLAYFW